MFNPTEFCFIHERIQARSGQYLDLAPGTLDRLSYNRIHIQHEPCDRCVGIEKPLEEVEQPRLFGRD